MNGFMKCSLARLGPLSGLAVLVMACGSDSGNEQGLLDVVACPRVTGEGFTEGNVLRLRGEGTFHFGDTDRDVLVALYVFDMQDAENGGLNAKVNYQFLWRNGDSFLTSDVVSMDQFLVPGEYRFNVPMTIVAGAGIFAGTVGTRPFVLDAEFTISPPGAPGDLQRASEKFTIRGEFCGS